MQQAPIFLVSSGRCGSTFFSDSINTHPQLISISELFEPIMPVPYLDTENKIDGKAFFNMLSAQTMSERVDIWLSEKTKECLYMPDARERVSLLLCYALPLLSDEPEVLFDNLKQTVFNYPIDTPANHFIRVCEFLKQRARKSLWIERSGGSLPHTKAIIKCWPQAKLIHFYRDGRETAGSMYKHPIFRMFVMKKMGMQWMPDYHPPIEEFGKMWSEWVVDAVAAIHKSEITSCAIAYEQFVLEPKNVLNQFLTFITGNPELSSADKAWMDDVASNLKPPASHYSQLSKQEQKRLDQACEPGMHALGYWH